MTGLPGFFLSLGLLFTSSALVHTGWEQNFFQRFSHFLVYKLLLSVLMGEGQSFRIGKPADGRSWDCPKTNSEKKEGRT